MWSDNDWKQWDGVWRRANSLQNELLCEVFAAWRNWHRTVRWHRMGIPVIIGSIRIHVPRDPNRARISDPAHVHYDTDDDFEDR